MKQRPPTSTEGDYHARISMLFLRVLAYGALMVVTGVVFPINKIVESLLIPVCCRWLGLPPPKSA